jgi:hypothetical protein
MTKFSSRAFRMHFRWIVPVFLFGAAWMLSAATDIEELNLDPETQGCLVCHSALRYDLVDPETDDVISMKMYDELRINPQQYANATHGSFACTDCHSMDYDIHPHPISVKFEPQYSCVDCHGMDANYAGFNFKTIESEFQQSVHGDHYIEDFSCWSCHNPHTYKLTAREGGKVTDIVAHNNAMCLSCHGDISHYAVLIERQLTNMLSKHDWLPNQSLHFRKVRCIDCHAAVNDDILVAHHVLPASQAVRNCVDCHSTNSILMASLYKHQIVERRSKYGFFNASITNEAYIIGANRNYYFNLISLIIFGMVLLGIAIHATLRYIHYRRKNENK